MECWPGVRCRLPEAQDSSRYDAFLECHIISHPMNIACKVDIDRLVALVEIRAVFQIDLGIPSSRSLEPRRQEICQEVWFQWCSLGAFTIIYLHLYIKNQSFIGPASHGVREGKIMWLD